MQFPWPVVPGGMAIGRVFGELGKFINIFADSLFVVRPRRSVLLLFHNRFLNPVAPGCLALLKRVPETHRPSAFFRLASDHVADVDTIQRVRGIQRDTGHRQNGWIDIESTSRHGCPAFEIPRGPFDDPWDSQAAFVNASFAFTATRSRFVQPSVVTAVPKDRVVGDVHLAQSATEPSHLLVKQRDLAIVSRMFLAVIKRRAVGDFLMRVVWRGKPNNGKHRAVVVFVLFQKRKRIVHRQDGTLAVSVFDLSVAT